MAGYFSILGDWLCHGKTWRVSCGLSELGLHVSSNAGAQFRLSLLVAGCSRCSSANGGDSYTFVNRRAPAQQYFARSINYAQGPTVIASVQARSSANPEDIDDHAWNNFFVFTVVRNPWTRMLSAYKMFNRAKLRNYVFTSAPWRVMAEQDGSPMYL